MNEYLKGYFLIGFKLKNSFSFQAQRKWEVDEEEHRRRKRDHEISMIEMEQVQLWSKHYIRFGLYEVKWVLFK